jgi:hypothetical protein
MPRSRLLTALITRRTVGVPGSAGELGVLGGCWNDLDGRTSSDCGLDPSGFYNT